MTMTPQGRLFVFLHFALSQGARALAWTIMTQATLQSTGTKLLWVGPWPPPPGMVQAAEGRWELIAADPARPLGEQLAQVSIVLIRLDSDGHGRALAALLEALERSAAVAVFMVGDDAPLQRAMLTGRSGQFLCVTPQASAEELSAKLAAAAELQPAIAALREELAIAYGAAAIGRGNPADLDEQLRLAARVQQDFLPRHLPEVGTVRFAALYQPAGWVSGDLYDVVRLDEMHVGFYVADVAGHGMPAALLTMFVKKALQTKRIVGHTYRIVPPGVSLAELNADICAQDLPSCHFCTAAYGVLDTATLQLTFASAGHPEPILIRADGSAGRLSAPGILLGVFPDAQFPSCNVQLAAGDRLILYTDGLEGVVGRSADGGPPDLATLFADWAKLSREDLLRLLADRIEAAPPNVQTEDDITVLIVDVGRE